MTKVPDWMMDDSTQVDSSSTAALKPAAPRTPPVLRPVELRAGLKIRQYELIRELGRGGMGQVFLARDTRLGRRVAIKFRSETRDPDATRRFIEEARTTARCSHENIVVIHDVDEHSGVPYLVLEYLEGKTLESLITHGTKMPVARAVELMVPVVRALVRAHESAIVHRDLKPENIYVTRGGVVKVLDFGVAMRVRPTGTLKGHPVMAGASPNAQDPAIGTLPYMAPEEFTQDAVDHRVDIWSVGLILYELLVGKHPLKHLPPPLLFGNAIKLDEPMPRVLDDAPECPEALARVIDRCLRKRREERYQTATELLDDLERFLPARHGRRLVEDESPFPGLSAFQEGDADRFFGRSHDVTRLVSTLRERPLIAIAGPSGIGKSSLVRAGVLPALRASGETWEVLVVRPGRTPLQSIAQAVAKPSAISGQATAVVQPEELVERLRRESGALGSLLRARAQRKNERVLLFIDQFEELYTLVADANERAAFTAALRGVADDPTAPLRVVVSIRSDFLDRVAEDREFVDELTRGLVFLQPLGPAALREALEQPVERCNYRYDSPELVTQMVDALASTNGALPLLQFTASKLWEQRDSQRKLLTSSSYAQMGGVAGALAAHANEVLAGQSPSAQRLLRAIFMRLVTPERTRVTVELKELHDLSSDRAEIDRLIHRLVEGRLLVVHGRDQEGAVIEIVHESLLSSWPMLRRWLDESQEDAVFLAQLHETARLWDSRGRPTGLLWRGEALEEARQFDRRNHGELAARDRDYLAAVLRLATRARRIRRAVVAVVMVALALVATGATIAVVSIRRQMLRAELAEREREHKERERDEAKQRESLANVKVADTDAALRAKNQELEKSLARAQEAEKQARTAATTARDAEQLARKSEAEARAAQRQAQAERARAEKLAQAEREQRERVEKKVGELGRTLR